jgi:hypothetical protein
MNRFESAMLASFSMGAAHQKKVSDEQEVRAIA